MSEAPARLLANASLVLPDRIATGATLVIENGRIREVADGPRALGDGDRHYDLTGHVIVPGFIDVHLHGLEGVDVLDGPGAVAEVAARLPARGVTAFCPTSLACAPETLATLLAEVSSLRTTAQPAGARVLPAHLESNFLNPDYRGAQPLGCLCTALPARSGPFAAADVLAVIDRHRADVGIVTVAPEIPGGMNLVRVLASGGLRVSIGHSGATFDETMEAVSLGVRHATHLFNRMSPMTARDPGVVGAVLATADVVAEIIADGCHVHPAVMRAAIAAKGPDAVMAISDGTAGSGLPRGAKAALGGLPIVVDDVARLEDGTMAGSVVTMDRAFANLVTRCEVNLVDAARMCATTPARALQLVGHGVIAPGAVADLAVLDARLRVVQTWINGQLAWEAPGGTRFGGSPS